MGDAAAFIAFVGILTSLIYFTFSVVRRKQQNAMQKHLLDKFSSTHDFTEFVQSPAGQKYVASFSDAVTKPHASILSSLRIGIVVIFVGLAFYLVPFAPDAREAPYVLRGIGTLVTMLGAGFLVSAIVAYVIAKRLNSEKAD
jgi:hypothetical protein